MVRLAWAPTLRAFGLSWSEDLAPVVEELADARKVSSEESGGGLTAAAGSVLSRFAGSWRPGAETALPPPQRAALFVREALLRAGMQGGPELLTVVHLRPRLAARYVSEALSRVGSVQ